MKRLIRLLSLGAIASGLFAPAQAAVDTYKIDPAHSSVGFTIRRFVGKVPGSFAKFEGVITVDRDNFANNTVTATIDVASVDTRVEKRDTHLKSADFFDAAKFPVMTFKSKSWKKTGDDDYDVTGDLTIRDVTKEVVLAVKLLGIGPGMQGATISGWEATTTLHRADFGINGPAMLGKMLGEDVAVTIDVEANLQK
jgi:polyisoprenoid-binding protein YceI